MSEEIVLVLELSLDPVLVVFDAIISFDREIASLAIVVESRGSLNRVLNALSITYCCECGNGCG